MRHYLLSSVALLASFTANADVQLKDDSDIRGKWNLYAEAAKLDGEKKNVDIVWDFADNGILHTIATDSLGRTNEMRIEVKYIVEDGVLKKEVSPGRGKFETCKAVEKTADSMVLKCSFNYFFLKK
ncbi:MULTISPECIES: hypothetical protein [Methylomicrobium]|uniref:Lipocalin-like domain-containing protein n=1 Tax=Methylomicrobium album BG8 TaxID=686340 RepID=H8GNM0_METAL|nr:MULTISPECIES: hypothetical protein [Methylomicrobium]EIC29613.1 hypothetical protein Metal_1847 [Methylomicrobium album BG8]